MFFLSFAQFFYYIWKTFKITYLYNIEERLYLLFVLNNRRTKKNQLNFQLNGEKLWNFSWMVMWSCMRFSYWIEQIKGVFATSKSGDCTKYKIFISKVEFFVVVFFSLRAFQTIFLSFLNWLLEHLCENIS